MAIPSRSLMVRPVAADPLSQPELLLPTPGRAPGLKRAFDFTVALVMFVFALPIIVMTLLIVRMTSRGPGLYSQIRLGRHGRPFAIYKVRTMRQDAETVLRRGLVGTGRLAHHAPSAAFCGRPTWMSCRNCGTCCAAT